MHVIDRETAEERLDLDSVPHAYRAFQQAEGIPVHRGLAVEWPSLETEPWDRTGERGAFVNLYGAEGVNDIQLHELTPGGTTATQRHLHDQLIYVAAGSGLTVVGEGDDAVSFEWGPDALFWVLPNTPYRHVNASGDEPARLLADTPLPQLFNTFPDPDLLFDPPGEWWPRYRDDALYDPDASLELVEADDPDRINGIPAGTVYWNANVVPDVRSFEKLDANTLRGAGGSSVIFPFEGSGLYAHVSEFAVGRYKKAHRHHPGANVGILDGEGFSLLWEESMDDRVRIDWDRGTLFTPPARWFHQHFNLGAEPARYFALHGLPLGSLEEGSTFDATRPENNVEYVDEDPDVRAYFEAELADRDAEPRMPDAAYEDPDYAFD
ncbi:MAG: hypothetical protein ABEJ74_04595 [Haloferacaceae archaeon]